MPRNPEVAPDPATSANAGPARPPVEGSAAPAGEDALRVPMPAGVPARTPPPGTVDLANVRPLMGSAVPAAPRPQAINLGGLVDMVREVVVRMGRLEDERAKFYAEIRKEVGEAVERAKAQAEMVVDEAMVQSANRAREIGAKIDERYAGEFEAMRTLRKGVGDLLQNLSGVAEDAKKAAEAATAQAARVGLANTKIDMLSASFDRLKTDLSSKAAADGDALAKKVGVAVDDASKALRDAGQAAKDFSLLNGRVQALENYRERAAKAGTGRR